MERDIALTVDVTYIVTYAYSPFKYIDKNVKNVRIFKGHAVCTEASISTLCIHLKKKTPIKSCSSPFLYLPSESLNSADLKKCARFRN